jgi:hypothetical protein
MASRLSIVALLAASVACFAGCGSDVGDTSAGPGGDDGPAVDGTVVSDAAQQEEAGEEASSQDTGTADSMGDSTTPQEDAPSSEDVVSTQEDTGSSPETGATPQDAGPPEDTGVAAEAAPMDAQADSTVSDAQTEDVVDAAGTKDVAADVAAETGGHDAGADSTAPDAGHDAGTSTLVPCTTTGQGNCVKCQGSETGVGANGGICTPTEAMFVQQDIDKGIATTAGNDPAGGCYTCLVEKSCLDDTFGDTGNECGDPVTTGTSAECLATLSCILASKCAAAAVGICYCGTAPTSTTCNATPSAENGPCAAQIAAGNGFPQDDGQDNIENLTTTTGASGLADQIFQCGLSNNCSVCQK